jgi:phospholipid/cholesterol/gamma-HCH transport system substrate-binding protein
MKENKINAFIALATVLAAVLMTAALSFAIGKWSFGSNGYKVTVRFPNATGITPNAEVKLAGVTIGRVTDIHIIPRREQDKDPKNGMENCVAVVLDVDKDVEVGQDVSATIKQDGFGIAAKYVLLTPGLDPNSPLLADNATVQGDPPYDLSDLIQPAGDALMQAKQLVGQLQPMMNKLGNLTDLLTVKLPPLVENGNKFLVDGDNVLGNFNSPDGKKRLNEMLDSLRVSTENLKVVSTNAKALTATLAEKPWRVFWGGSTIKPPSEDAVLDSNKVIRLKPDVDVNNDSSVPAKGH